MNYDIKARMMLAQFHSTVSVENLSSHETIRIATAALLIYQNYCTSPEKSNLAQSEYFQELLNTLTTYKAAIISKKSWWQRLIGFFGILPEEENQLQRVIKQVKSSVADAVKKHDRIYYPNFLLRVLRFFGFNLKEILHRKHYDEYRPHEKLTYLSHHLMGKTDLNHHEILQGKAKSSAYQHFANDINDFIKQEGARLDGETKELFKKLLTQIGDCSKLANELDSIFILNQVSQQNTQQEFISDLTYRILKALIEMSIGDSLIIPHGFHSTNGGHATVIECMRVDENNVVLKIINTGAGEEKTESYRVLFKSLFTASNTRPIKVTSPLSIHEIINNNYIEELLTPLIIETDQLEAQSKMTSLFLRLYQEGKLHDDTHHLTLQTNGTCGHSSLLEWFKTRIPESAFLLFNLFVTQKSFQRLEEFRQNYNPADFAEDINVALTDLSLAGKNTVNEAQKQLLDAREKMANECRDLKLQLNKLLQKKGKTLSRIANFTNYYEKKCLPGKLKEQEQEKVAQANPMTSWSSTHSRGLFSIFSSSQPEKLSERAEKAILAKKIAGHESFLETINLISVP
ncbi:hypothetical protein [Legionella cardiaca]|uniref:Uncharacterized protein n=1 Tax=Legionella cardiaca TaxID=1071983 RepID=A0ABY8AR16_9GAMM|nr:hypothetical protein [Legionella cardiaca]WED42219.1 hypothetical protein PXX05_09790 [Legionella cardiaca]